MISTGDFFGKTYMLERVVPPSEIQGSQSENSIPYTTAQREEPIGDNHEVICSPYLQVIH